MRLSGVKESQATTGRGTASALVGARPSMRLISSLLNDRPPPKNSLGERFATRLVTFHDLVSTVIRRYPITSYILARASIRSTPEAPGTNRPRHLKQEIMEYQAEKTSLLAPADQSAISRFVRWRVCRDFRMTSLSAELGRRQLNNSATQSPFT